MRSRRRCAKERIESSTKRPTCHDSIEGGQIRLLPEHERRKEDWRRTSATEVLDGIEAGIEYADCSYRNDFRPSCMTGDTKLLASVLQLVVRAQQFQRARSPRILEDRDADP